MRIGYRTIKTAIGTPLAIWLAELLQLDHSVSAGIITLLCIQPTRKRSFQSSWHRFGACLLAMLFSTIIFELIGYQPLSIGILLLLFIPTTVKLHLSPGIVTSSVILLHFYTAEQVTLHLFINELLIITIGIGIALLLNLYMPSLETNLKQMQEQVEKNFSIILREIAIYLREGKQTWTGKEITETENLLDKAERTVVRDLENHLLRDRHPFYDYFIMRKKQFDLLKRMLPLVSQMSGLYEQSYKMANLFEELADAIHPGNTAIIHLKTVRSLKQAFEEDDLPKTRQEFETRANLFRLLHEIEQYLILKKNSTPRYKLRV
ncbi:aromatic acid exporter family protein [Aquibacillus koreensis]|uniref:Aromatic acid exporter family protein n=1 Tax=Aquibacillus koreensis TaxID=279446 RepID=A0A9X3WFK6_9BACI|nr:aromatic acid exporter family protein [Aquibacillus koreensis]MCT2537471.1 aromatic acid exporter family protein [Aquibacillus koreensis]MDC3418917.1 aromatic acid exporter family protein [Aquibacillus koreensis]